MDKQRVNVFLALVLVLLIVAAVMAWTTGSSIMKAASHAGDNATSYESSSQKDKKKTDDDEGRVLDLSGSISSQNSDDLKLRVDWHVTSVSDSEISIETEVYLCSYEISTAAHNGTLRICGKEYSFVSQAIECSNGTGVQETLLYSSTVTVAADVGETVAVPISATWNYNGSYGGRQIDRITAEKTVTIQG